MFIRALRVVNMRNNRMRTTLVFIAVVLGLAIPSVSVFPAEASWEKVSSGSVDLYGPSPYNVYVSLSWNQYYDGNNHWKFVCTGYSRSEKDESMTCKFLWPPADSRYNEWDDGGSDDSISTTWVAYGVIIDYMFRDAHGLGYINFGFTVETDWRRVGTTITLYMQHWLFNGLGETHQYNHILLVDGTGGGSGCPYVAPWDGNKHTPENNLLISSESNPQGGVDFDDYYQLNNPLLPKDSRYSIEVQEFENEHSFFDQFKLFAIDHHCGTHIAVDPNGKLLTYRYPRPPYRATSGTGENVKLLISEQNDGKVFVGNPGNSMILNFPKLHRPFAKLLLYADALKQSIHVQLKDEQGFWTTVEEIHPRVSNMHMEIVDLAPFVSLGESLEVRLLWTGFHILDFVGLDTSAPGRAKVSTAPLLEAIGADGASIFDLIFSDDSRYAELYPGQEICLEFGIPYLQRKLVRDYVFFVNGYYIRA